VQVELDVIPGKSIRGEGHLYESLSIRRYFSMFSSANTVLFWYFLSKVFR